MTREEAVKFAEHAVNMTDIPEVKEFYRMAAVALTPPTQEQMERVWPGCPACKEGPPKIHVPAFRAMAICNQHMDHEAFDIELSSKFCLNCGRPLTPTAWEELRKRWEALYADIE